jgi:hypothetical protein
MKIKAKTAGITFIILMVGGLALSIVTGYWATVGSKQPVKYTEGAFAGENNPADIRGSYAMADITKAFDIPVDTLVAAFGLGSESNPETIQVKSFEAVYGIIEGKEIGTDSMRYFVALYKGLPFVAEEDTALPRPAISILRKEGAMTAEELALAEGNAVSLENRHPVETREDHDDTVVREIKGKTMFSELYDWGITKEELEKIIGLPVGVRTESVRDYCMANGIEFSTVKTPVQELLDSK